MQDGCHFLPYLGSVTVECENAARINKENMPTASLPWHIEEEARKENTVSLFILSVLFIPFGKGDILVDIHIHGNTGAFVAFCPQREHLFLVLEWFKFINGLIFSLGSVTNVTFN